MNKLTLITVKRVGNSVGVFVVLWALPCLTSDPLLRFKDNPDFYKTSSTFPHPSTYELVTAREEGEREE